MCAGPSALKDPPKYIPDGDNWFIDEKVDLSNLSQICSVQVAPAKWTGRVVLPQPFRDAGHAEEVAFGACHGIPENVVTVYIYIYIYIHVCICNTVINSVKKK